MIGLATSQHNTMFSSEQCVSDLKRDVGAPCRSGTTQTATADQQASQESKEDTDKKYRQGCVESNYLK